MVNEYLPPMVRTKFQKFLHLYFRGDFLSLLEFATALEDLAECARSLDSALRASVEQEVNQAAKNQLF